MRLGDGSIWCSFLCGNNQAFSIVHSELCFSCSTQLFMFPPSPPCLRPRQVAQVAFIASYWTKLNKNKRAPHHINKDGVMGEMTGGFSILLR